MRGGIAHALHALYFTNEIKQFGEVGGLAGDLAAPGVDVLPEQRHFFHSPRREAGNLGHHVIEGPRHFLAPGIRHDAEAAVLAASLHDRDERGCARDARGRQVIEFLDLGEAHVDLRLAACAPAREQLRQPVQCLRAEHHVDVGRALDEAGAFLARDAAADRDHQCGVGALQMLDPPQIGEHLLLRLLAHRAGVEHDDVGVLGTRGGFQSLGRAQHAGDLLRVVLVHLAAEGTQKELAHYGLAASSGVRIHTWRTWPSASSRYFTCTPAGTAVGRITRFDVSRICAPGARRCGAPSSSISMSWTWRNCARFASSGMERSCALATAQNPAKAAMARKILMSRKGNGGESGTRTPDTRIMIPLL